MKAPRFRGKLFEVLKCRIRNDATLRGGPKIDVRTIR